ncbi:hypothetical protein KI387_027983 [Taxus chinensis]|uniref:UBZ4-type domain-containing protein n=1 Tax=Taxus chinensis TaxID=29808 RepID=A0AA38L2S6_TAXCH|nr:hypothetical protein KI387_027983 [Taxus chinensis]
MTTDSAIDVRNFKMNLGCNATPALNVSTTQDQKDHMMKKNDQKDIGGDDAVADDSLDRIQKFSIRKYVFSVRVKDTKKNWPFSQKYLQTCLENGRQPLLPPFESRNDILQKKIDTNGKENMASGNDIQKINSVSDCSDKEKFEDPEGYKHGIYREGWINKQKSCPRKKKMVPTKARNCQTSTGNGKVYVVEDIVDVERVTKTKGHPINENDISRKNDDRCQETERNIMISCESQGIGYVAITDVAHFSDSVIGEHREKQVSYKEIDKQQKNQFVVSDKHLNAKSGNEVRKKRGKKIVTSEPKTQEDNEKEQNLEKNKDEGEKNDDFGNSVSLSDALVPKVCPVCRTFSSTSNTALNAHIDHCLSVESNAKKAGTRSTKPKVRAIKKRSLADICAEAPNCTLKDLEHNTCEEDQLAIDENELPLDDLYWRESQKRRRRQHKAQNVYVDSKGKKLQILSNLKEHLQPKECQQRKLPKKRKKMASTTLDQCSQQAAKARQSVSSEKSMKKVYATSPCKHAQSEETVKMKPESISLGTACEERPFVSRSARVDTKKKKLGGLKQVTQEQVSYNKIDGGSTDVLETTRKNSPEEELHRSPSKSAFPLSSDVKCIRMPIPGKTKNARWAPEMSESDFSPSVKVSGKFNCKRIKNTSRLHSQNETIQNFSRNELASCTPTFEEGSRPNAESASQLSTEVLKLSKAVINQSLRPLTKTQVCSNLSVSASCQDSPISFTSHGAPMIGHSENKSPVDGHGTIYVSTETPAHVPGVSIQDPSNEVKQVPSLYEENAENFFPAIFHENLNPNKTMQETVAPQRNSGTQCVSINDAAKERVKPMSLQKQALGQNPAVQNDISCLNSVTDTSALLNPSNRQFITSTRDPVLSNILNAKTNGCASSSSTYFYNELILEQSKSHSTHTASLSENVNSNNIWMTEMEHSNPRSMKERPQAPAQKFASISDCIFGDSVCSSSSTFFKGLPLTSKGNLLQKRSFQSKDSQYLNHQSSFGNMKLTSVTVPQVVSASTLAKQLDEGKTAEEILHGCVMIEQNSNACNSQSNHAIQSSAHNNSISPLEKQIGLTQNLNNSLFGTTNGSYGGNQVVGV